MMNAPEPRDPFIPSVPPYAPGPPIPRPPLYQPPMPYPPPVVVLPQVPTSGLATASMVLGIVGLTLCLCFSFGIPSILAVIFGHMALGEIKRTNKGGHGMAVAGLATGYVGIAPAAVLSFMVLFGGLVGSLTPTTTPTP